MENSTKELAKSKKANGASKKHKHSGVISIEEAKEMILLRMRTQKFVLPPSILRNHGRTAPPITFRAPKFDLKRKRPSVMMYPEIESSEKRETRSQRLRRNETENDNDGQSQGGGSQLTESGDFNAFLNSYVKDRMKTDTSPHELDDY